MKIKSRLLFCGMRVKKNFLLTKYRSLRCYNYGKLQNQYLNPQGKIKNIVFKSSFIIKKILYAGKK